MSYKEEHLNEKSRECSVLWYAWYEIWSVDRNTDCSIVKEARKKWCKCAEEHAEMIHEEYLKMREKYGDVL